MGKQYSEITNILDSFAQYLAEKGRADNTIKTYCGVLQSFFKWLDSNGKNAAAVKKQDIQLYIDYLKEEQRSVSTINKVLNTINTFAKSIDRLDMTKDVCFSEKESTHASPEFLSNEEVQQLLDKVERDGNKRNAAIAHTLLKTGIRVSELCLLNISSLDLNHQTGQLVVKDEVRGSERTIPLPNSLVQRLKEYLNSRNDEEEALFLSNYQKRISPRTVQHMLQQFGVHPHKLRHTFCYELIEKGMDLSIVAQLAGHSDINVTKQYMKAYQTDQAAKESKKYA